MTPFDAVIANIAKRGYHNHRKEEHSDLVSTGIWRDLRLHPGIAPGLATGSIGNDYNVKTPGARGRKIDLFVGELPATPDTLRIGVENKSVITAHRNADARHDDLLQGLVAIHRVRPAAVMIATVMVGLDMRVLNVPDYVKRAAGRRFATQVLPRLSTGDQSLWTEFAEGISENRPGHAARSIDMMRSLPTRQLGHTHVLGFDFVLIVPVRVNNVDPPSLARDNPYGIDHDADYAAMIEHIGRAYATRWT